MIDLPDGPLLSGPEACRFVGRPSLADLHASRLGRWVTPTVPPRGSGSCQKWSPADAVKLAVIVGLSDDSEGTWSRGDPVISRAMDMMRSEPWGAYIVFTPEGSVMTDDPAEVAALALGGGVARVVCLAPVVERLAEFYRDLSL